MHNNNNLQQTTYNLQQQLQMKYHNSTSENIWKTKPEAALWELSQFGMGLKSK